MSRRVAKALAGVKRGTVLDHATAVYGVHKGAFVAAHIVQAAVVAGEHGRDFSNKDYCEWWGVSERTGWQHRAEVESVYGDGWRDVIAWIADEMKRQDVRSPGKATRLLVAV